MKHLKTFENINKPQIGDYVVCKRPRSWSPISPEFDEWIITHVGQIIKPIRTDNITRSYTEKGEHYIIYHDAPDIFHWGGNKPTKEKPILDCWWDTENHAILLSDEDILFYSKNKEYAESYLYSRKYNL